MTKLAFKDIQYFLSFIFVFLLRKPLTMLTIFWFNYNIQDYR